MSFSILLVAGYLQAAGATYNVFVATLSPLAADEGSSGAPTPGVTGEVTVFVTPAGLLGDGSASNLEQDLQFEADRRLSSFNNVTTAAPTAAPAVCTTKEGSCGVSIHEGGACTTKVTQGAPFHAMDDAGKNMSYRSTDSDGNAAFSFSVTTPNTDITGKVLIVHNSDGRRVACGILEPKTSAHSASLAPLGDSDVSGEVTLYKTGAKIVGAGRVTGFEHMNNIPDSLRGGLRVDSGDSCSDLSTSANSSDPWANVGYTRTQKGAFFTFSVASEVDIAGMPFVVTDNDGSKVACGLVGGAYGVFVAELISLNVGNEPSGVTGEVTVFVTPAGLLGIGSASGLEPDVQGRQLSALQTTTTSTVLSCSMDGCGLAIHDGSSCSNEPLRGAPYYEGSKNYWMNVSYPSTDSDGHATFSFAMKTLAKDIGGKPFVVHNREGVIVACGVFGAAPENGVKSATLAQIGSSGVTGAVTVYTTDTKITGAGDVTGLTPSTTDVSDLTESGARGVAVHDGTACTDSTTQGNHYFEAANASDPWAMTRYTRISPTGDTTFTFSVTTSSVDVAKKPFLVNNDAGAAVACGLFAGTTQDGASRPGDGSDGSGGSALVNGCSGMPVFSMMAVLFAGMFSILAEL